MFGSLLPNERKIKNYKGPTYGCTNCWCNLNEVGVGLNSVSFELGPRNPVAQHA